LGAKKNIWSWWERLACSCVGPSYGLVSSVLSCHLPDFGHNGPARIRWSSFLPDTRIAVVSTWCSDTAELRKRPGVIETFVFFMKCWVSRKKKLVHSSMNVRKRRVCVIMLRKELIHRIRLPQSYHRDRLPLPPISNFPSPHEHKHTPIAWLLWMLPWPLCD
jgi:hypothetical protein